MDYELLKEKMHGKRIANMLKNKGYNIQHSKSPLPKLWYKFLWMYCRIIDLKYMIFLEKTILKGRVLFIFFVFFLFKINE